MMKIVKVSDKGQIAIPQEMRERAGIKRGDALVLVHYHGRIVIEREEALSVRIADDFTDLTKFTERSLKSVWDNKSDDIWKRYLK